MLNNANNSPERNLDDLLEAEEVAVEAHEGVGHIHAPMQEDAAHHGTRKI